MILKKKKRKRKGKYKNTFPAKNSKISNLIIIIIIFYRKEEEEKRRAEMRAVMKFKQGATATEPQAPLPTEESPTEAPAKLIEAPVKVTEAPTKPVAESPKKTPLAAEPTTPVRTEAPKPVEPSPKMRLEDLDQIINLELRTNSDVPKYSRKDALKIRYFLLEQVGFQKFLFPWLPMTHVVRHVMKTHRLLPREMNLRKN